MDEAVLEKEEKERLEEVVGECREARILIDYLPRY